MATDYVECMKQFERAFFPGSIPEKPTRGDFKTTALRILLIDEESEEVCEALADDASNLADIAKELADLLVVTFGTAVQFGIDIDKVFQQVHESNMSKLNVDGLPIYNENGKAIKGPNYKPPDLSWLKEEEKV